MGILICKVPFIYFVSTYSTVPKLLSNIPQKLGLKKGISFSTLFFDEILQLKEKNAQKIVKMLW